MRPTILIANSDRQRSALLAKGLREHARNVVITDDARGLQNAVPKHRPDVVVADLETINYETVAELRKAFAHVNVVCTHRVPDEQMWAAALEAGASDCCCVADVDDIVRAALGQPYRVRRQAA